MGTGQGFFKKHIFKLLDSDCILSKIAMVLERLVPTLMDLLGMNLGHKERCGYKRGLKFFGL